MNFENKGVATAMLSIQNDLLVMRVFSMGGWNMVGSGWIQIAHTMDVTKIVSATGTIINDFQTIVYPIPYDNDATENGIYFYIETGNIMIVRHNAQFFQNNNFDNIGINRGHITVWSTK